MGSTLAELLGRPLNATEEKFAPESLFCSGRAELLSARRSRVAVVGSRKASDDALARARRVARLITSLNGIVVSGLAEGVDAAAHLAAMETGDTIAVLGTPLDKFYPNRNESLQRSIAAEHLVISQFAHGAKVQRWFFTTRNRTMALISDASVIVEAREKSGTLSQGWETLRLGRPLFIMKSIFKLKLSWPKEMVRYGAQVLEQDDQLRDLLDAAWDDTKFDIAF